MHRPPLCPLRTRALRARTALGREGRDQVYQMVEGCDAMIICTSAVPRLVYMSLLPLVFRRCLGYPSGKPEFFYEEGASPEEVSGQAQVVGERDAREESK